MNKVKMILVESIIEVLENEKPISYTLKTMLSEDVLSRAKETVLNIYNDSGKYAARKVLGIRHKDILISEQTALEFDSVELSDNDYNYILNKENKMLLNN